MICNFEKVYNQQTKIGEMIAKQLCNPRTVLSIYARKKIEKTEKVTSLIDFGKYCICSTVIVLSILRLFLDFPGDIKIENNKRKYFNIQKRNDCYLEYVENHCNATTSPELLKYCQKLYDCYSSIDINPKKVGFISFEWELINYFFFYLTKKSAAFLGFLFGCFLYYNLIH